MSGVYWGPCRDSRYSGARRVYDIRGHWETPRGCRGMFGASKVCQGV